MSPDQRERERAADERSLEESIGVAVRAARLVRAVTIGPPPFDPMYPYHRALRRCPFCGDIYRRHGGHADHRDRCEDGPRPGANPPAPPEGWSP